jgi:hypothetical protein
MVHFDVGMGELVLTQTVRKSPGSTATVLGIHVLEVPTPAGVDWLFHEDDNHTITTGVQVGDWLPFVEQNSDAWWAPNSITYLTANVPLNMTTTQTFRVGIHIQLVEAPSTLPEPRTFTWMLRTAVVTSLTNTYLFVE